MGAGRDAGPRLTSICWTGQNEPMSSYHRLISTLTVAAAALLVAPTVLRSIGHSSNGELFPLSRWSMFNKVFTTRDDFGLRVIEVDGKRLDNPTYLEHAGLKPKPTISTYYAIQAVGQRLGRGDELETAKALVERTYLPPTGVKYEIVARKYDVLRVWQGETFTSERVLATFDAAPRSAQDMDTSMEVPEENE
jgi:hypothetical protein